MATVFNEITIGQIELGPVLNIKKGKIIFIKLPQNIDLCVFEHTLLYCNIVGRVGCQYLRRFREDSY